MKRESTVTRLSLKPNQVRGFRFEDYNNVTAKDLLTLGISMDAAVLKDLSQTYASAIDAAVSLQTTPSITNPVQFFQYWAPEAVEVITAARKIDDIAGREIAGSFEDEEIVTTILEKTGRARPYSDTANIPLSSYNSNFTERSIVRFEEGLEVGYLENMRASRMRIDSHEMKAEAAAESLAIELNNIGFYGYANGQNKTYGFLNDPNLPAYQTVAQGSSANTGWETKSFNEITSDIITAVAQLVNQLAGKFDPTKASFTLVLSLVSTQWLNTMNELGTKSVFQWLRETYPKLRIESAVELNGANGGSNVFYMLVDDISGKKTIKQYVPDVFRLIGVEKKAKVVVEDYACATAGLIVLYPVAVVRYSGI